MLDYIQYSCRFCGKRVKVNHPKQRQDLQIRIGYNLTWPNLTWNSTIVEGGVIKRRTDPKFKLFIVYLTKVIQKG